ncbi:extensin-like protein [Lentzea atacamensis]|uniref:Extensin-like protein n=1 Tax=Lentzea atacamensis TaxID=531938 RepID=A0A316I3S4_9PSEU|nr:extensin family protein [Lentzea atacamensis]PWK88046.1 extensin-like protein [Lentzea atacamensis]RAS71233.1 extensin-like protein [Lentzea atacamensis]
MFENNVTRRGFVTGAAAVAGLAGLSTIAPGLAGADPKIGDQHTDAEIRAAEAGALAMMTFQKIDGTPVYYWRSNRGNTTARNWQCTDAFYNALVAWIRDLRSLSSSYGSISYIVSAGFYVNKPGQHGAGTAMDLDHVRWSGGNTISPLDKHHASSNAAIRKRYLATEAVCRRRFRYVLDGWYNADHADHIHADFGGMPVRVLKDSESDTKFVQAVCNNFRGSGLVIDGDWGTNTQNAFNGLKSALGVTGDPHTSSSVWQGMLSKIATKGFANQNI